MRVELPYKWAPRDYQEQAWSALESGKKRVLNVWHRRAGKDLFALNWLATQVPQRTGLYWHMFPTYSQGRKVAWEGMDRAGRPFLDAFPPELTYRKLDQEMTLYFHGGSQYQVVGTDHMDRLVGANPIGVIMSEYAIQNPAAWDFLRPILAENDGWAIFAYTPRGHNHGYRLYRQALSNPNWFAQLLTVEDTGAVPLDRIEEDRASGMSEAMIEQEYYCSFSASLESSYYGDIIEWMEKQDPSRITKMAHDESSRVITGWDLGIGDSTAIWFAQIVAREFRLIDYYEASGVDISHYVRALRGQLEGTEHRSRYIYGPAYLPHDARARSLASGLTVEEQMRSLGVDVRVCEKHNLEDQHAGVRKKLRETWINEERCDRGIQALKEYSKQEIHGMKGPDGKPIYRDTPLHNWASHGASALATLMMNFRDPASGGKFSQPSTGYIV